MKPVRESSPFWFMLSPSADFYTLSLHDALPIFGDAVPLRVGPGVGHRLGVLLHPPDQTGPLGQKEGDAAQDRKSTRLNSSHVRSSYAVFCLKKKRMLLRGPRLLFPGTWLDFLPR